jgi:hypothetical protein
MEAQATALRTFTVLTELFLSDIVGERSLCFFHVDLPFVNGNLSLLRTYVN